MPADLVNLNGQILPRAAARIDPFDRGLVFGDALYEVVKVAGGRLLHLEPHLGRLSSGLDRIEIPAPHGLELSCRALVKASEIDTGSLFLQVTRGVAPRSHRPPVDLEPTVLVLPASHGYAPPAARPRTAITMLDPRWQHCDLKTTSMLATVTGKLAARAAEADEVVFVGPAGEVREGGTSNLFVRHDDRLETCPLDGRILPGVTRAQVLGFANALGYRVLERAPRLAERDGWQEAFLCGTLTGIQPLAILDRKAIGLEPIGDWTGALARALEEHETALLAGRERGKRA
ncbi:MAG: aminotransferase class IV [Acidobacteriota bacterium]|nr:aminotransferase class IV [Acidobacteriota bacterium]